MRRIEVDLQRVIEMYLSGVPVHEIAKEFDCSSGPIYRELIDAGVLVSRRADIDPTRLREMYVDECAGKALFTGLAWSPAGPRGKPAASRSKAVSSVVDLPRLCPGVRLG